MIMTASEAATKRCTIALVAIGKIPSANCIGEKCAHWSYFDYANADGNTFRPAGDPFQKGRATGHSNMKPQAARGYCGLTGSK